MTPTLVGLICAGLMMLLILLRVPVAVALGLAGFIGFVVIRGFSSALGLIGVTPYEVATTFEWSVLPLFILMGAFANHAGLGESLYESSYRWFGRLRGGIAISTIMASGAFGAISGSSVAAAALFTKIGLPKMLGYKYHPAFAGGCIAAAGTFASLIPPSALLVFYGIMTEQSVGKLFMAGVIPGILTVGIYAVVAYFVARQFNWAPPGVSFPWRERLAALRTRGILAVVIIAAFVSGGIFLGLFSATEAGAWGAFVIMLFMITFRGRRAGEGLRAAVRDTVQTTTMIMAIVIGAIIFSRLIAVSKLATDMVGLVTGAGLSPVVVIAGFVVLYLILGCFLDAIGMLAVTLPVVLPAVEVMGFSPIWWGIMSVKLVEIGLVTPPVGMNIYTVKSAAGDLVSLKDLFRGSAVFCAADIAVIALLIAFPQLALWLPERMR